MKAPAFAPEQAYYLAMAATEGRLVTYGEMAKQFGGIAQGWGPKLTQMGRRLHAHDLPVLPVIVVSKGTDVPSPDADFYREIGLLTEDDMRAEQQRCFNHDWTTAPFWESSE